MKILYAVQATGNGHISRAMELLPYLERYGSVDIFLSGANSSLEMDAPVKFRSKGISLFYTCTGRLSYSKMIRNIYPWKIIKEINDLPVEKYDLVINDFECITSMACAKKKIASVNFGHQASFLSDNTPRPEKISRVGEWVLKNYAKGTQNMGLHFQSYDDFIFSPVIKKDIIQSDPKNKEHITVYLPSYCDNDLRKYLQPLKDHCFEIFSHQKKEIIREANLTYIPIDQKAFNKSLINCYGIITGGGFETPSEALYLKKKLIAIPIRGQYEQQCNAAALKKLGVPVIKAIDDDFTDHFNRWMSSDKVPEIKFEYSTEAIVEMLMCRCTDLKHKLDIPYPHFFFN